MKYWKKLTKSSKIVFILWTIDSCYMLFSGNSGINFFQWLVVWIFGCFIFVGIAQLISSKAQNKYVINSKNKNQNQESIYIEYKKALDDIGISFSNFFKEAYYVNTYFLSAKESENGYVFTFKAESKEQLRYLLSNQKEMYEKLDGKPVFNILFDTTFQMNIDNTSKNNKVKFSNAISNFDDMEGHDFEYFCADILEKNGYENVEVTKGSGDQGIDIIAYKDGIKYGIQCKCYSSDIGNKAVQEAFSGKTFYHCHVAAVLTNRYFTTSAKELSESNGVLLWDRDYLNKLIENLKQ